MVTLIALKYSMALNLMKYVLMKLHFKIDLVEVVYHFEAHTGASLAI